MCSLERCCCWLGRKSRSSWASHDANTSSGSALWDMGCRLASLEIFRAQRRVSRTSAGVLMVDAIWRSLVMAAEQQRLPSTGRPHGCAGRPPRWNGGGNARRSMWSSARMGL
ncbi:unnamed protein product [Ectocarpus sp. CCAP 1310/34]|nr:unnamed protein product [Ectocarpus sp. CCAP 1310/34]